MGSLVPVSQEPDSSTRTHRITGVIHEQVTTVSPLGMCHVEQDVELGMPSDGSTIVDAARRYIRLKDRGDLICLPGEESVTVPRNASYVLISTRLPVCVQVVCNIRTVLGRKPIGLLEEADQLLLVLDLIRLKAEEGKIDSVVLDSKSSITSEVTTTATIKRVVVVKQRSSTVSIHGFNQCIRHELFLWEDWRVFPSEANLGKRIPVVHRTLCHLLIDEQRCGGHLLTYLYPIGTNQARQDRKPKHRHS